MRKNMGSKPQIFPEPVFIIATYDEDDKPDAMNAAWGGISNDDEISLCLSANHKTVSNIIARKALTISPATADTVAACDYVGIVSGNKQPDKVKIAGFHVTRSQFVDAPLIDELPLALECELISYDEENCRLVARIVNIAAEESILDDKGQVDAEKMNPITFDPFANEYRVIGQSIGKAFSIGKTIKK